MEQPSSRQMVKTWGFTRHKEFELELREAAARWFAKHKKPTHPKMKYCLKAHDDWHHNIICDEVTEYIEGELAEKIGKDSFPLHKYVHHGLSSQAMVFNLVGPLIVRDDLEPLREVIEQARIDWPTGEIKIEFEHDDRSVFNEDVGQPTSIDLAILGDHNNIFIEAKLAEREFGGCSVFAAGDCDGRNPNPGKLERCYLQHIGRKYWESMEKFKFHETAFASGPICPFTSYYQFFREVLFALEQNGYFLLLHDTRNPAFLKKSEDGREAGLWPFLMESVPDEHIDKIGRITIQQLLKAIEDSRDHTDWIDEFKTKYGL